MIEKLLKPVVSHVAAVIARYSDSALAPPRNQVPTYGKAISGSRLSI